MPNAPRVILPLPNDILIGPAAGATLLVAQWYGFDVNFTGINGQNLANLKLWQIEHFIDILSLHLSIPLLIGRTFNITGMADVFQFLALDYFVKH